MEKKEIITRDLALAMTKAYDKQKKDPKRNIGKEDTKYVYIPMSDLTNYLNTYSGAKGIKVYFGIIDDHKITSDPNYSCYQDYKKQTTIILKATDDASFLPDQIETLIVEPIERTDADPLDEFGICPPSTTGCNDIYETK